MTQAAIPDYLKQFLPKGQASDDVTSLASAQNSTPRISLRGRMFRFMVSGEEVSKSAGPITVHIVGVEPGPGRFTKTYYETAYAGSVESNAPPDCSSDDGVRPNSWVTKPQGDECQTCKKNQFGSATSRKGKPSKACADSKRIHVTKADDVTGTLYLLQTPVSSLKALAEHGRALADMGVESWMPITEISMVDAEYPELEFKVSGFVTEENIEPLKLRAEKKEWMSGRKSGQQAIANNVAAMPAHIQALMPSAGQSAKAAAVQGVVDVTAKTLEQAPSNGDVLKNW